ncbi:hypothetical protein TraAM80_05219 [Trypanosoma rangeli]|uniref:Uncharacterized protein n=1 Tax=Trypanosoma rangeli TaxID=5698 RepID=A0A3R7KM26_TRYRA|nr:uncharacterized protein TraAM80_05219 [Trypanosoma rangeli]RNF04305.1 hypothetical protein TraAM80_05219 [Trypanosoma rangeli]|eukprot:RNF04305.1 hypothetical protein TraAM80_05219 [Trypanosoma rangeli]
MGELGNSTLDMESDSLSMGGTAMPAWYQLFLPCRQSSRSTSVDYSLSHRVWLPRPRGNLDSSARSLSRGTHPASDTSTGFLSWSLPNFAVLHEAGNGYEGDSEAQRSPPSLSWISSASQATTFDDTLPLVRLFGCSCVTPTLSFSDEYHLTPIGQRRKFNSHLRLVRFPDRKYLVETRRRAAATIIRWWRSREARAEERRLFALALIQRVGRRYLVQRRIWNWLKAARNPTSQLARRMRVHANISALLHKLVGAGVMRVSADGVGFSLYGNHGLSYPNKGVSRRFHNAASSGVAKANASMRGWSKHGRGVQLVNCSFGNNPAAPTAVANKDAKSAVAFGANSFPVSSPVNETSEPMHSPFHSYGEGVRIFSHTVLPNNAKQVEETRPRSEAFCCMFNSRVSLEPLSIRVVSTSPSIDHAELGPWNPASAKRSTILRVRPNTSLI